MKSKEDSIVIVVRDGVLVALMVALGACMLVTGVAGGLRLSSWMFDMPVCERTR